MSMLATVQLAAERHLGLVSPTQFRIERKRALKTDRRGNAGGRLYAEYLADLEVPLVENQWAWEEQVDAHFNEENLRELRLLRKLWDQADVLGERVLVVYDRHEKESYLRVSDPRWDETCQPDRYWVWDAPHLDKSIRVP
jgi:hypothetical protein